MSREFVGALLFVPRGYLDRVARITEIHEVGSLNDAAAVNVETGNYTLSKHNRDEALETASQR